MATYEQAREGMARGEVWQRTSVTTGRKYVYTIKPGFLLEKYTGRFPELQKSHGYFEVPGLDGLWLSVGRVGAEEQKDTSWEKV